MTVEELLARMSGRELTEWMAYDRIDPFGSERDDLRAGSLASPLVNLWLAKGETRTRPSDWIMKFDPPEPPDPQDWREMRRLLEGLAAAMKGKHTRTEGKE